MQIWQKELDNSGFPETKFVDLSRAHDCLPMDYLKSREQQTKVGSSYSKWSKIKHGIP